MAKQTDHLAIRDHHVFSKISADEWRAYAGMTLVIDPQTDRILDIVRNESDFDENSCSCSVVEFFPVPKVGSLRLA